MSVPMTLVNPAVGALPSGDLVWYTYNDSYQAWQQNVALGVGTVTSNILYPFPDATYKGPNVAGETISGGVGTLTKIIGVPGTGFTLWSGSTTYKMKSGGNIVTVPTPATSNNSLFAISNSVLAWGLGKNALGSPEFSVYWAEYEYYQSVMSAVIPIQHCVIVDNSVKIYGTYVDIQNNKLYALLNKTTGRMLKLSVVHDVAATPEFIDLFVPVGGEIKQFIGGYYFCTNGSGDLFLYSINNGGELVTQLDPGTFDVTQPIEFFQIA